MSHASINWSTIDADPRFRSLYKKKTVFLSALTIGALVYFLLLPIGVAYVPEWFAIRLWGPLNLGLVFALSEFVVAWIVAHVYVRRANREFDALAETLRRHGASSR